MKITHVLWSFKYGGAETLLIDIVNRQCEENQVSLIIVKDMIDKELLNTVDSRVDVSALHHS
jgi:hypothetical protein